MPPAQHRSNRTAYTPKNIQNGRISSSGPSHIRVPPAAYVHASVHVSITLKQDQGTGREVQGTVAESLTRGDHPRGVKVRLVDGRVGRVQRIVPDEADVASTISTAGNDSVITATQALNINRGQTESTTASLADYVVVRKGKNKQTLPLGSMEARGASTANTLSNQTTEGAMTSRCPVCADFEGDEAAVAWHVGRHFS